MSAARTKTVLVGCALALATSAAAGTAALVLPEEANAAYPGDNGRLAFCIGSSGGSIDSVSSAGFGYRQEVPNGGGEYTCDPAYSPGGTKLAFTSDQDEFNYDLYVKDLGSGQVTQLTDDQEGLPERRPSWSPDGKKMVFDDQDDIWVMDADGSNRIKLTDTPTVGEWQAAWSPKGTKIAFQRADDIWVMDADGSDRKNLTRTPNLKDAFASWSPNGRRIVWAKESSPDAPTDVWKMRADGSGKTNLTPNTARRNDYDPVWSPDGGKIAFIRDGQIDDTDIWKMDASDGSNKSHVTDNDFEESSLDWQPKLAR
jgi:Tol biopolymer transport system component